MLQLSEDFLPFPLAETCFYGYFRNRVSGLQNGSDGDQFNTKLDNSKFVTGKRLGYDFNVDDI